MIFWLGRVFRGIRMAFRAVQNVGNQWVPEIKKLNDNIDKLQESLAGTDDCVVDIYKTEEALEDRMGILEEELNAVKAENIEMRTHFNSMIKELNAITAFVNEQRGHKIIEQTFEIDPPPNKGYNIRSYVDVEDSFDT